MNTPSVSSPAEAPSFSAATQREIDALQAALESDLCDAVAFQAARCAGLRVYSSALPDVHEGYGTSQERKDLIAVLQIMEQKLGALAPSSVVREECESIRRRAAILLCAFEGDLDGEHAILMHEINGAEPQLFAAISA